MPPKSLISRLKRLTWKSARRTGRSAPSSGDAARPDGEGLRILRPPEVGGRPMRRDAAGESDGLDRTMDVVIKSALDSGVLTPADLTPAATEGGLFVDWRTVCTSVPDRADSLRRFAAGVYGFKPVVISQVGTLVLADRLTRRIPQEVWSQCFRLDCIPVLPHGVSMSSAGHVTLACSDPARAAVRNLARSFVPGQSTLAYADASIIDELKSFLAAELPLIADAVGGTDGLHAVAHASAA